MPRKLTGLRYRTFVRLLVLAWFAFAGLLLVPASSLADTRPNSHLPQNGIPLAEVLRPDGTLDLPRGQHGTLDPTGFGLTTGPDGQPHFAPLADANPGDANWSGDFNMDATNRLISALAFDNAGNLYAGGDFDKAGTCLIDCRGIAMWDGSTWSALETGVNFYVRALAIDDTGNVYVGGYFTEAGSCTSDCKSIARWDGSTWNSLGTGVSYLVNSLAIDSTGKLYAGGDFATAGECMSGCQNIAMWDGSEWNALSTGMDSLVMSLAVDNDDILYAGGFFSDAGSCDCNAIARWNGSIWQPLGNGTTGFVQSLAIDNQGHVYAGGYFSEMGACASNCNNIALWDGSGWTPLGTGADSTVLALDWHSSGHLYAGGSFSAVGNCVVDCNNIALWDGSDWNPLDAGIDTSNGTRIVNAIAINTSAEVFIGGDFFKASTCNGNCTNIARWFDSDWHPIGDAGQGAENTINALAYDNTGNLYAGGDFYLIGNCTDCNGIARWNGTTWSPVGASPGAITALAVEDSGIVYAAGNFYNPSCFPFSGCTYIAQWDGTSWSLIEFDPNSSSSQQIYALAVDNAGNLYVGGIFSRAGSCTSGCNNIAKWNNSTWSALGTGTNGIVRALVYSNGSLYVGGGFTSTSGCSANCHSVARWDSSGWHSLSGGMDGGVIALAVKGTDVYAGGTGFTEVDTCPSACKYVAHWDGVAWNPLGNGLNFPYVTVRTIAVDSSDNVYVGGNFTAGDTCSCENIARWSDGSWYPLGNGVGSSSAEYVSALATDTSGHLMVGGAFSFAGGKPSRNIAQWTTAVAQQVSAPGSYSFYADNLPVIVDVVAQGNLASISIQRIDENYPGGPPNWQTGYYWHIEGFDSNGDDASGFNVTLTLPTPNFTPTEGAMLCRNGDPEDCQASSFTSDSITRSDVDEFSDWVAVTPVPTAVDLARLNARMDKNNKVRLTWETGSEMNVTGFNLYRTKASQTKWSKRNKQLILSQNIGQAVGGKYGFTDKKAKPGKTYRYKLEIIRRDGKPTWSKVVKIRVP